MRLSNLIRRTEDAVLSTKNNMRDFGVRVSREFAVQRMYHAEQAMAKQQRLRELRAAVKAFDDLYTAHADGAFEDALRRFREENA